MKKTLLSVLLFAVSFLIVSCGKQNKNVLHIYDWSDYIEPDLVKKFEKKYDCKLILDFYDSNESMFAKLKAGCTGYDIIFPSSYMADMMNKQGMLLNLDKNRLPNLRYIDRRYLGKTKDINMDYSVPFTVCFTGIGYNSVIVKDIKPTWNMFGDKKYRDRMTMFNDMREVIGAALKYLGYSMNTVDNTELKKAKIQLLKWKKNLAAFQVDEAKTSLGANILLVIQMYNGDGYIIGQDNPVVKFIIPEEGTSLGTDSIVIPADSLNKDLAYKFINFLCEPENAAVNMEYIGYLCPNIEAYKLVDKDFLEELVLPDDIFEKSEVIHDLGRDNSKYIEIWDEIKALD